MSRCGCRKSGQRGIADTSGRLVDYPLERLIVIDIDHQLEISHHILDLGPFEEGVSGIDHIRKIPAPEGLLKGTRLHIGPVENRKVLILRLFRLDAGQY